MLLQIRPSSARGKWTNYSTVMIKISKPIFYISTLLTGTQHNNIMIILFEQASGNIINHWSTVHLLVNDNIQIEC